MASRKPSRKISGKKPPKAKTITKPKSVAKKGKTKPVSKSTAAKKKTKTTSGKKGTGVANKIKKVVKSVAKKKTPAKAAAGKKKVGDKKAVSKKTKATSKKTVLKSTAKSNTKKTTDKKLVVQAKKTAVTKKNVKPAQAKPPKTKMATPTVHAAPKLPKPKEHLLSANERYNIGGLFACAMERRHDPDCSRLRAVLRYLDLASQEKDNLIRLSEGFMIPKLFAENLPEPKVNQLLADLVKFGIKQGNYEKYWREEFQQIGFWLGVFPAQFHAIQQQVKR
jgi:hypothetical protein